MKRLRDFWIGETDLAPLALFRIVFGIELFNWFWQLYPNLAAFFTDEGILPRFSLLTHFANRFSLLDAVGSWWQVAIFWAACLVVALLLTFGWHTRTASILAFVAVSSFSWRDPLILDGSDFVFRLIPFWLAFTNAGDLYSVDSVRRRERGEFLTGRGPALPVRLLELQVGWIYLMTGLEKLGGTLWKAGTASYFALQLEHTFGRSYAYPIATQPILFRLMTWSTLVMEVAFLPLIALPSRITRLLAVAMGLALHGGILVLMNVGNFPVIMLSTLILFVPAPWVRRFCERIEESVRLRTSPRLLAAAAGAVSATERVGWVRPRPTARDDDLRIRARRAEAVLLVAVALAAFSTALPGWLTAYRPQGQLNELLMFFSVDQRWDMFAPDPARSDGWMLAPAKLADGTTFDLLTGGPVGDAPRWADPLYTRWLKVQERIAASAYSDYRLEFGRSFCRFRNNHLRPGESPLDTFQLTYIERTVQPPGEAPTFQTYQVWSHKC